MCKPLFGTGSVVNMDNYYTSPEVAVALRKKDVFIRGTCRTNRLGFPEAVKITNSEANNQSRGLFKKVIDTTNHIAAYGWIDGNPVHFITTADGTTTTEVKRRVGKKIERIKAPIAIKRYNQNMHAVDRHDQLRETFSLSKRHGFKKYYCKVAMGLLDMAVVNAWLHFKLVHKDWGKRKSGRYEFITSIANAFVQTDWNEFSYSEWERENERVFRSLVESDGDSGEAQQENEIGTDSIVGVVHSEHPACQPLSVAPFLGENRKKKTGFCCQVCNFEGRGKGKVRSVVICLCHRIRLCTVTRTRTTQVSENSSWMAPEGLSCWFKAHSFYIPNGLFSNKVQPITDDEIAKLENGQMIKFQCVRTGSELYKMKHLENGTTARKKSLGRPKKSRVVDNAERKIDDDYEEAEEDEEKEDESFKTAESGGELQGSTLTFNDSASANSEGPNINQGWI